MWASQLSYIIPPNDELVSDNACVELTKCTVFRANLDQKSHFHNIWIVSDLFNVSKEISNFGSQDL